MEPEKIIFLIDERYPDVDAAGDVVCGILPIKLERRQSDYLGGNYVLYKGNEYVVQIRNNYSSFLDEWYIDDVDTKYVMIVTGCRDPNAFAMVANLPGFRRRSTTHLLSSTKLT